MLNLLGDSILELSTREVIAQIRSMLGRCSSTMEAYDGHIRSQAKSRAKDILRERARGALIDTPDENGDKCPWPHITGTTKGQAISTLNPPQPHAPGPMSTPKPHTVAPTPSLTTPFRQQEAELHVRPSFGSSFLGAQRAPGGFMVHTSSRRKRRSSGGAARPELPCFDYRRGNCSRGGSCPFKHDSEIARSESGDGAETSEAPLCQHGIPCTQRRRLKPGPNCGRLFFGCPRYTTDACPFFEWAKDPTRPDAPPKKAVQPRPRPNYYGGDVGGDVAVDADELAAEGLGTLRWESAGASTFG
jgi:hypothetical protein